MSQAQAPTRPLRHLSALVVGCSVLVGCAAAPAATVSTAPVGSVGKTAVADVVVIYKGVRILDSRIATPLDQEARIDTRMDDGHQAALRVTVREDGTGHYQTTVNVAYDGTTIASNGFLSSPGQSAVADGADVQVALRVSAGS